MATVHSYYDILGIVSSADLNTILKAISNLRQRDLDGNYTATLNTIEKTLADPEQRRQYDDSISLADTERSDYQAQKKLFLSLKKQENNQVGAAHVTQEIPFLDISEKDMQLQKKQALLDEKTEETSTFEDKELHYPKVFPVKKILLIFIILGLVIIGIMFSKPLYVEYQAHKQAEAALDDLFAARDNVMQYIREHKVFPQNNTLNFSTSDSYEIKLMPNQHIKLIFNAVAVKKLRGSSYELEPYEIPNTGLDWHCSVDDNFPADYKPARCF